MSEIKFDDDAPYEALEASARAVGHMVEVTFQVIEPGEQSSPAAPIRFRMTADVARYLHAQLQPSITTAEVHSRER
jgi:hypothetical protein